MTLEGSAYTDADSSPVPTTNYGGWNWLGHYCQHEHSDDNQPEGTMNLNDEQYHEELSPVLTEYRERAEIPSSERARHKDTKTVHSWKSSH